MPKKQTEIDVFYAEASKIRGELGELRGAFNEFKESMSNEISDLKKDISDLRSDLKTLDSKMDRNFRWTIGITLTILIPMWVTIMLAILLRG